MVTFFSIERSGVAVYRFSAGNFRCSGHITLGQVSANSTGEICERDSRQAMFKSILHFGNYTGHADFEVSTDDTVFLDRVRVRGDRWWGATRAVYVQQRDAVSWARQ